MKYNRRTLTAITVAEDTPSSAFTEALAEVKDMLRVSHTADDNMIKEHIGASITLAENYTRRAILSKTLEFKLDRLSLSGGFDSLIGQTVGSKNQLLSGNDYIDLPMPPITAITSIKTYGVDNTESTLSSAAYSLDEAGGRVYLNQGYSWPVDLRDNEAIFIRYTAGYATSWNGLPVGMRTAIKLHVSAMYDNRCLCSMPEMSMRLLDAYRLYDDLAFS